LAQAAILLCLGRQLRGDDDVHRARLAATGLEEASRPLLARQEEEFPIPQIGLPSSRYLMADTQQVLRQRFGKKVLERATPEALHSLATRLYKEPSQDAAAHLLEACLAHPDELCRVAAAFAYFPLSGEASRMLEILAQGTRSTEEVVFHSAAIALARCAPTHPRLDEILPPVQGSPPAGAPGQTTLLIHGTFARQEKWWQPGGDFHSYILDDVRSDLYNRPDAFRWSGRWDHGERAEAARELQLWLAARGEVNPGLWGHSHGANVAMIANQSGLQVDELVLLSCPVHPEYSPRFELVRRRVVSFHVKFDLVILVDGGGQRFTDSRIEENILEGWFLGHSDTHNPDVWKEQELDKKV
jgi:hypothetical protein